MRYEQICNTLWKVFDIDSQFVGHIVQQLNGVCYFNPNPEITLKPLYYDNIDELKQQIERIF